MIYFVYVCVYVCFFYIAYSNYEDSEYEQQSSNMDDSSLNGPATLGQKMNGNCEIYAFFFEIKILKSRF